MATKKAKKKDKNKATVLDLSGKAVKDITLPMVFMDEYRPDLIRRAVLAMQSHRRQPKGPTPLSGRKTSAECWGTGRGMARVPRIKTGSRAARAPQTVGGRRAHPPKTDKVLKLKINKKEKRKAVGSAIAATIDQNRVRSRGHRFSEEVGLPIVVEDAFTSLEKTSEVEAFLKCIGVWDDILRAKARKVRAGRGTTRGRRYKSRKSILIVIPEEGEEETAETKKIKKTAKNLPGVDVSYVDKLNAELLAPGTHPGRLTIWSESSLNFFAKNFTEAK
ncbi:MAG: 50S ribosomal protein L4 [Euryarchaeota archaeon]|nr:50S ribosomal protein L4 [Euryarchaeota archaeon]